MVILQLKGGLGNQLFQYAAGLGLAMHHNVLLKVDIQYLKKPDDTIGTIRNYELQQLIAPPNIATNLELSELIQQNIFARSFEKLLPTFRRKIYAEKSFEFDSNFFKAGKNIYLKGYRQSEKYFINIEDKIRNQIKFQPTLLSEVANYANFLQNITSISIHIRRGDYTNTNVNKYHGVMTREYYQQAINTISSLINNPSFFIFSDNIDWVKDNLQFSSSATFVSGKISKNHYQDFYLMSQCKHNIIANSSFSWWAAWLNNNQNKIVIAPKKWFNNAPLNYKDLIPESWIKI